MATVMNERVKINYEVQGEGLPLVFVHGYTGCIGHWRKQLPEFSKKYKVIAIDLRGMGKSDAPEAKKYSISDHISDLHSVLSQEKIEKAIIIGQSMGARIAIRYCLEYPEGVAGLVSIGGLSTSRHMLYSIDYPLEMVTTPEKRLALMEDMICEKSRSESLVDLLLLKIDALASPLHGLHANIRGVYDPESDVDKELGRIEVPTLLVVGTADMPCPPTFSKFMYDRIPLSQLHIFDHTGHLPNIEMAKEFNQLLSRFIEENIVKKLPFEKCISYVFRDEILE